MVPASPDDVARPDPRVRLAQVPLGRRVVVRHLIDGGDRATDALGELVGRDDRTVTVRTRRGAERIELDRVVVAKEVPRSRAGAWRIPPFLRRARVAVLDLDGVLLDVDRGTPIGPTVQLVDELTAAGTPTFVLTDDSDGGDGAPARLRLERSGLARLVPVLIDAATLSGTEPAPDAFAAPHAQIEARLGRTVGRAEVHLTDDDPVRVDAARAFGWQARVFTLPPDWQA